MLESVMKSESTLRKVKYRVKLNTPVGQSPVYVWINEKTEVMVFQESGKIRAISSLCPHMGAQLVWRNESKTVFCPWHGLEFQGDTLKSCHHRYRAITEYQAALEGDELIIYE
jgi:nitrite reductase/ring-hydroxylating ferredoxin subunit